jgi:hypothetical protein
VSRLLKSLHKLVEVFADCGASYAVLGGLAMAAYGVPRSTVDVDIGLAVSDEGKVREIMQKLNARNMRTYEEAKPEYPVVYLSDLENLVDVEIWFKPDGITWSEEVLKRRWMATFELNGKPFSVYVLSPEDFIVNKLARVDRTASDEEDVVGVMASSKSKIDWKYLDERAKDGNVSDLVHELRKKISPYKRAQMRGTGH